MTRAEEAEINRRAGTLFQWPDGKYRHTLPPAPGIVLTAGYGDKWKAADLFKSVRAVDGVLLDIRMAPYSKSRPQWCKDSLQALFQLRYQHIPALGNINYRISNMEIQIADIQAGMLAIEAVLLSGRSPVLLCGCRDYEHCHRRNVAEELAASGIETRELDWFWAWPGEVPTA